MLTVGGRVISELQVGIIIGCALTVAAGWVLIMSALAIVRLYKS